MYNTQARNDRENRVKTLNTMYNTQAKKKIKIFLFFFNFPQKRDFAIFGIREGLKDNQEGLKDN